MFDTMTWVKAAGGFLSAFLVFLLANWAGTALYSTGGGEGHGGEHAVQGYVIMPKDHGKKPAAPAKQVSVAEILASGDPAKGAKIFSKCKACHKINGTNATGPHLDGVVGRAVASVPGFNYSQAMKDHGGTWTPEALYEFLANPKGVIPGTKMSFAGLKKPQDRADLIAYLETLSKK